MSTDAQIAERSAEIAKILVSEGDLKAFQQHLETVISGEAFRGSQRSAQFLRYVVDRSVSGHCDELKERLIGVELFGRSPSYDTGEDAIVRVTASDVRRRLLQHYGRLGTGSEFRIRLPLGTYIPEISRIAREVPAEAAGASAAAAAPPPVASAAPVTLSAPAASQPRTDGPKTVGEEREQAPILPPGRRQWRQRVVLLCCLGLAVYGVFAQWRTTRAVSVRADSLWGMLFGSQLSTKLITSDPNIVAFQTITGQTLTLSDYANRSYVPQPEKMAPPLRLSIQMLLADEAAAVDTGVAVALAEWMDRAQAGRLVIQSARTLRFSDLLKDGNFILLGSPRSNPWVLYYSDHLDFRFFFDPTSGQEIVENLHPRSGESKRYVPTALGNATGQSYAVASYLRNPDHAGHVLLVAGANAEGTEAVANLMTDAVALSEIMNHCGLSHQTPIPNFQFLLQLNTMAGSPGHSEVIACHVLSQ
jgi:hypothetical protein